VRSFTVGKFSVARTTTDHDSIPGNLNDEIYPGQQKKSGELERLELHLPNAQRIFLKTTQIQAYPSKSKLGRNAGFKIYPRCSK
jgi:hypothetical protein